MRRFSTEWHVRWHAVGCKLCWINAWNLISTAAAQHGSRAACTSFMRSETLDFDTERVGTTQIYRPMIDAGSDARPAKYRTERRVIKRGTAVLSA